MIGRFEENVFLSCQNVILQFQVFCGFPHFLQENVRFKVLKHVAASSLHIIPNSYLRITLPSHAQHHEDVLGQQK